MATACYSILHHLRNRLTVSFNVNPIFHESWDFDNLLQAPDGLNCFHASLPHCQPRGALPHCIGHFGKTFQDMPA